MSVAPRANCQAHRVVGQLRRSCGPVDQYTPYLGFGDIHSQVLSEAGRVTNQTGEHGPRHATPFPQVPDDLTCSEVRWNVGHDHVPLAEFVTLATRATSTNRIASGQNRWSSP